MDDRIKGSDFVSAQCKASAISESMSVAYWLEANGVDAGYHVDAAVTRLHKLAEIFGFDLVERAA